MSTPWTEKYRPRRVAEIVGNKKAVGEFIEWMKSWQSGSPSKRAALLAGPPGVGKTSLVYAYAAENGYDLVEVNASDKRTAESIRSVVGEASRQSTLLGTRKRILLIDEVDGAYGSEMTGGVAALAQIISSTMIPIVLVANNPWDPRLAPLREKSLMMKFSRISRGEIASHLRRIATMEGLRIGDDTIKEIAERAMGDMRSAINDLQIVSKAREVDGLLKTLSTREREKSVFEGLAEAFGAKTVEEGRRVTMNLDVDLDTFMTWLVDNIPLQIRNPDALRRAYDWLAEADLHLSRARREQRWGLMRYATPIMGAGVGLAKKEGGEKGERFEFPSKIRFMQESRQKREVMRSLLRKVAAKTHMSTAKAASEMLPFLRQIVSGGNEAIAGYFELDSEEVGILSGRGATRPEVERRPAARTKTRRRASAPR